MDGGWSSWGSWEKCRGLQCDRDIRFRKCDNPAPRYDGRYCPGPEAQKIGGKQLEMNHCWSITYKYIMMYLFTCTESCQ